MALATRIWRVILPDDVNVRRRRLELTVWAFVLSLAFYPGPWGFLAWVALVRPIMIFARLGGKAAFRSAYLFGFLFNLFSLYWVALVTPPGMITAVAIVALYYAVVLCLFVRLHRWKAAAGYVALPLVWVGMEYFRTLSEFAFPWSDLGYTQAHYLWVLQIVSVIGVHGLSLLIVAVNVLLAQVFRPSLSYERRVGALFGAAATVGLVTAYGWVVLPPHPKPGTFGVALLQGSVPLDVKWSPDSVDENFALYERLTASVADSAVKLFVWPETAAPCYITHAPECQAAVGRIAAESGTPHLVGTLAARMVGGKMRHYNSAVQFDGQGVLTAQYGKVKLVPFSEHVPYQDHLRFLEKDFLRKYLTFIDEGGVQWWSDFYPGDSLRLFAVGDIQYAALICFEVAFPEYVRAMVRRGANFLVEITNDTWFERSVGVHMHSRVFITRAVENRSWGARAANSGLTYIVDDYGRIREGLDLYAVQVLAGKVGLLYNYSVFTRIGDVAGRGSFLLTAGIICIFIALWCRQKLSRFSSRARS